MQSYMKLEADKVNEKRLPQKFHSMTLFLTLLGLTSRQTVANKTNQLMTNILGISSRNLPVKTRFLYFWRMVLF